MKLAKQSCLKSKNTQLFEHSNAFFPQLICDRPWIVVCVCVCREKCLVFFFSGLALVVFLQIIATKIIFSHLEIAFLKLFNVHFTLKDYT